MRDSVKPAGMQSKVIPFAVVLLVAGTPLAQSTGAEKPWQIGTPIVTYWAGPPMTDKTADQMAQGGWNLVWCTEKELDVAARHGLRAQLHDGLLSPESLEDPLRKVQLDGLIQRVKVQSALYSYFITDEPNATNFPGLGRLVAYLRDKDPAHLAYINLFPTYASNQQLGNSGDKISAYQAHLAQYLSIVKPSLISYDHYQLTSKGDSPDFFLNLALIRQAALDAGVPFLNIVQAASWTPSMRVPTPEEVRFLLFSTLAYGGQGISYYVYSCAGHTGGIATADGSPTPLYDALKGLNRTFVAIARELQPLRSVGVYHAGMLPPGGQPLQDNGPFALDPPLPPRTYRSPQPLEGALLGLFAEAPPQSPPTYAVLVNVDYRSEQTLGLRGPGPLEIFNPATGQWTSTPARRIELKLSPGAGALVRVRR